MDRYEYGASFAGVERVVAGADGTQLRTVSVGGDGDRAVLLAHGYGFGADAWSVMAPMLVSAGLRVIAFDHRGHGRSTIGSAGIGTAQMAADFGSILEAYELQDTILVGHSMSGFLSLAFLLDDHDGSERVGALALVSTFAGDVSRSNPQNRLQIPLIKSGILPRMLRFGVVATAFTKSLIGERFEPGMTDAFIPVFLTADHANLVPILRAMVDESRYDRLGGIDLPCTVVVGDQDKTTPPFHTNDLHAGISGSKLVRLPGIGHAPNWEAPETVVAEIVELAARAS